MLTLLLNHYFQEQIHAAYLQDRSLIGSHVDSAKWKYDMGLRFNSPNHK